MAEKQNKLVIPLAIVLAIALAVSAYLAFNVLSLEKDLKQTNTALSDTQNKLTSEEQQNELLTKELSATENELSQKIGELSDTKSELGATKIKLLQKEIELNKTKKELNETEQNLEEIKGEFDALSIEVGQLDETLSQSIQWFKENAVLPAIPNFGDSLRNLWYEGFLNNVNLDCIIDDGSSRTLKLACVPFVMEKTLSFTYKSEDPDKLFSFKEMILKEGGDCEDFSLFTKGLLNLLKKDGKNNDLLLEGTAQSSGGKYTIYGDPSAGEAYWYIDNAKGLKLAYLNEIYPYPVCYMVTAAEGHCIVALSNGKINDTDTINELQDAILFEPQNGQFMGYIGTNLRLCENGDELCSQTSNSIMLIITEDDLYQFTEGEWKGYENYKERVAEIADKISVSENSN